MIDHWIINVCFIVQDFELQFVEFFCKLNTFRWLGLKQVEVQRMEYILYSSDSNTVHIRQPENPAATIAIIKDSPTSFPQIPTPCSSN